LTEIDENGNARGWPGGYCISFARFPDQGAFQVSQPIPQSNCPSGSAIIPALVDYQTGDSAPCLATCTNQGECRAGYDCVGLYMDNGSRLFSNGVCVANDCLRPGQSCPEHYTCETRAGSPPVGRCVRESASDGGTQTDASAD
jgi:hypothetical protein